MNAAIEQRDREAEEIMREKHDRYTKMIKKVESNTGMLRSNMNNLLADRDKRVARMEQEMKEQQAAHQAELKKTKQEEQRRREKEEREKAPQRQRQAPVAAKKTEFALYSLTIANGNYMCINQKLIQGNCTYPARCQDSTWIIAASLGDDGTWIAAYSDGRWERSSLQADIPTS
ncbi:hypothetical protein BDW59DRAFT_156577 [Aspergillus cavernicola]|uniref:Uncharacterized protein n=1 Tax=Aspergillus cavernicola TaxID=176166 RepID=A0ABR4J1A4_9EURO